MSKRRFATGEHEFYDLAFMRLKNESQVLAGPSFVGSVYNQIFDENGLLAAKLTLTGEADISEKEREADEQEAIEIGSAVPFTGKIPRVKRQLKTFDIKWRGMQLDDVHQGKEVRADSQMPKEMLEEQLGLFARLDIYTLELEKIQEKLDAYKEVEQVADDRMVLRTGLMEVSQLHGGVVCEIDGQICEKYQGILIIKDERSPYSGMQVSQYRSMAKDWRESRRLADLEHLKVLQEAARSQDKPVPRYYSSCNGIIHIPKGLLPKWPEGVTNYLESVPVKRKRQKQI